MRGAAGTDTVAAAVAGDRPAFDALAARHRRELQVHCYRMLGSFEDAEDQVQETLLRAWHRRATFRGRASYRAWLYGIATNACLDLLARRPRPRPGGSGGPSEVPWLQPFPDRLLEPPASAAEEPDAVVVERETIELAFLVALQHLPPRQRAVFLLRDVLGWSAKATAALAEATEASVNSALQRARATLRARLPGDRLEWAAPSRDPSAGERQALKRYVDAHASADVAAVADLLREDVRFTMPPQRRLYEGRDALLDFFQRQVFGPEGPGEFRLLPTRANRQPAAAHYVRTAATPRFRALALDVLRVEGAQIAEITTFEPRLFAAFGLPGSLE